MSVLLNLLAVAQEVGTTEKDGGGTPGLDIGKYLAQYGIFGAVMFDVFVTRKFIIPRWSRDEAVASKDEVIKAKEATIAEKNEDIKELKQSLAQLQTLTRDQILPALVRANQLSADYVQEITRHEAEPRPRSPRSPRQARSDP